MIRDVSRLRIMTLGRHGMKCDFLKGVFSGVDFEGGFLINRKCIFCYRSQMRFFLINH